MTYWHFAKKKTTKSNFYFIFRTFKARRCNCFFRVSPVGTGSNLFYTFVTFYVFYRIFSWAKNSVMHPQPRFLSFWFHLICFVCRRSEIVWQSRGGKNPLTFSQEKNKLSGGHLLVWATRQTKIKEEENFVKTHMNTHVPLMRGQLNLSQTFIFHGNQLTEINKWPVETHVVYSSLLYDKQLK